MKTRTEDDPQIRISSADDESLGVRLKRWMIVLLILAGLVLVGGFFAAQSRGGRDFLTGWIEKYVGLNLQIGKTGIGWPYDVVLEDVVSDEKARNDEPAFKAQEIRLGLSRRPGLRVEVLRAVVNLQVKEDGGWWPEAFARMGTIPVKNLTEISKATAGFRRRIECHAKDCSVRWLDPKGGIAASATGLTFDLQSVRIPRHRMYLYRLGALTSQGVEGDRVDNVSREWLASDRIDYVELARAGADSAGGKEFWNPVTPPGLPEPPAASDPAPVAPEREPARGAE